MGTSEQDIYRLIIEAIEEAAEAKRDEVPGDPTDFNYGYTCGLERAMDIVQVFASKRQV